MARAGDDGRRSRARPRRVRCDPSGFGLPDTWQLRASNPYGVNVGTDRLGPVTRTTAPTDYGMPDSWQPRPDDPYGIRNISSPAVGSGFQLGDGSIGGAVGLGLAVALLALCIALVRRNRHRGETGKAALA